MSIDEITAFVEAPRKAWGEELDANDDAIDSTDATKATSSITCRVRMLK
jgi:hypothetical protein